MTHTFVSLTNRKAIEKFVVVHSTKPVHQERSTHPSGAIVDQGVCELPSAPLAAKRLGYMQISVAKYYSIFLNMQSHNCEGTVSQISQKTVTPRRRGELASTYMNRLRGMYLMYIHFYNYLLT